MNWIALNIFKTKSLGTVTVTQWEQTNINKLCQGTTKPKEPGECFNKVMTGHVKWGDSDKWQWENAIRLCAETSDSDQTITCFQNRVHADTSCEEAILQCQLNAATAGNAAEVVHHAGAALEHTLTASISAKGVAKNHLNEGAKELQKAIDQGKLGKYNSSISYS